MLAEVLVPTIVDPLEFVVVISVAAEAMPAEVLVTTK